LASTNISVNLVKNREQGAGSREQGERRKRRKRGRKGDKGKNLEPINLLPSAFVN
jgi:hypothetical protein